MIEEDGRELASRIKEIMVRRSLTLSTAESFTSGRIAATLTTVSGSSDYFQGGLVAYQDELKTRFLGVDEEVIKKYDVVSQPVVEAMVKGACRLFSTDLAMASTGYAGSGANGIPDGTLWIGWGTAEEVHSLCLQEDNGREKNTSMAVVRVLREFLSFIE